MSATLASVGLKLSNWGLNTYILAEGTFTGNFGAVINILNMVGLVLAFGGLLFAAVMFMMGQTERMIYGLVGAVVGGMSWIIVKTMFSASGASVSINL